MPLTIQEALSKIQATINKLKEEYHTATDERKRQILEEIRWLEGNFE